MKRRDSRRSGARNAPFFRAGRSAGPGFTLLEMLIALALTAVVLSMVYAGYMGTARVAEETESQARVYAMARTALARMTADLESASLPHVAPPSGATATAAPVPFRGETRDVDGSAAASLTFPTLSHLDFSAGGPPAPAAAVAYDAVRSERGPGLVLLRSDTPLYGAVPATGDRAYALCNGLSGVRFTYMDGEGRSWNRWDSENALTPGGLPVMVTAELDFINPSSGDPMRFKTSVALPTAGTAHEKAAETK